MVIHIPTHMSLCMSRRMSKYMDQCPLGEGIDICMGMCVDMFTDICIDVCMDVCMDVCPSNEILSFAHTCEKHCVHACV